MRTKKAGRARKKTGFVRTWKDGPRAQKAEMRTFENELEHARKKGWVCTRQEERLRARKKAWMRTQKSLAARAWVTARVQKSDAVNAG